MRPPCQDRVILGIIALKDQMFLIPSAPRVELLVRVQLVDTVQRIPHHLYLVQLVLIQIKHGLNLRKNVKIAGLVIIVENLV